jgi:hypothetical protein
MCWWRRACRIPGKRFFFEKKKQKTFAIGAAPRRGKIGDGFATVEKVLWFFLPRKNDFLPMPLQQPIMIKR